MKLSKDQIRIVLDLSDGPRSYVPAMQVELEGLEKEGLIHVIFRPSPLVQPVWGLTKKGRLAVTVARVLISAALMSGPKEKPPAPGSGPKEEL